jgi:hypothetical protein
MCSGRAYCVRYLQNENGINLQSHPCQIELTYASFLLITTNMPPVRNPRVRYRKQLVSCGGGSDDEEIRSIAVARRGYRRLDVPEDSGEMATEPVDARGKGPEVEEKEVSAPFRSYADVQMSLSDLLALVLSERTERQADKVSTFGFNVEQTRERLT